MYGVFACADSGLALNEREEKKKKGPRTEKYRDMLCIMHDAVCIRVNDFSACRNMPPFSEGPSRRSERSVAAPCVGPSVSTMGLDRSVDHGFDQI